MAFFEVTVWRFSSMIPKGRSRTCKAMKPFLERLAGGRRSFRDLGMGETAALSLAKGMRRGQDSPVNKSLKKSAREPWNERKSFMVFAYFD